jgi:hypothetical protein
VKNTVRRKWAVGIAVSLLVISVFYAVVTLTPWSVGMCGEEVDLESTSPGNQTVAKVFIRNCGATTGYLTHVNLKSTWNYFNTTWVGTISQGEVFGNGCEHHVRLVWIDESHLEIGYVRCPKIEGQDHLPYSKKTNWNGVTITYREVLNPSEMLSEPIP